MIKHKPIPKTGIKLDGVVYRCNRLTGIVELPVRIERFNPIEEEVIIKKPKKKKEVVKDDITD